MTVKLTIPPQQAGYSVKDGQQAIYTKLDGGAGRFRQDMLDPAPRVKCKWVLNKLEYEYLKAFYKTISKGGANVFLIDLIVDQADLTEHEAHFIPNTFSLASQRGHSYTVNADLEIKPITEDESYNESLVDIYNAYGDNAENMLNIFEVFVNVTIPNLPVF